VVTYGAELGSDNFSEPYSVHNKTEYYYGSSYNSVFLNYDFHSQFFEDSRYLKTEVSVLYRFKYGSFRSVTNVSPRYYKV